MRTGSGKSVLPTPARVSGARKSTSAELRNTAFREVIASIPKGKVATYGQVAKMAGYPLNHRAVARFLKSEPPHRLPWQRVVGAGGEIKLPAEAGAEQRLLLRMEGVAFRGRRVNLKLHQQSWVAKPGNSGRLKSSQSK